jgi:hypothetical protein
MLCLARVDALDYSKGVGKFQGPPCMLMILSILMRVILNIPASLSKSAAHKGISKDRP